MSKTKQDYIIEFFNKKENHNIEITLSEADQKIKSAYSKDHNSIDIYTHRTIRNLPKYGHSKLKGTVEKVSRGVYKMIPGKILEKPKSPFPQSIKERILKRDGYQCQWCGKKQSKETFLAIDHIIPEDENGKGIFENGITLCYKCNNIKKNLGVSSFGKKMFERYLKISKKNNDENTENFLNDILSVFNKYNLK
ncbi:HNH endonuclease [Pelagibacteraceae bacterium]|nr:HNH endonuclease [Pelagibacteraceae bacterium]